MSLYFDLFFKDNQERVHPRFSLVAKRLSQFTIWLYNKTFFNHEKGAITNQCNEIEQF